MQNYESTIKGPNFEDLYDNYKAKCRRIAILERYIKRHLINTIDKSDDFNLFSKVSAEKARMDCNSKSMNSNLFTIDRRDSDRIDIIIDYESLNRTDQSTQVLDFFEAVSPITQSNVKFSHVDIQASIDLKTRSSQTTQKNQTYTTQTDISYFNTSHKSSQKSLKFFTKATNTKLVPCNTTKLSMLDIQPLQEDIIQSVVKQKEYTQVEFNEVFEMNFEIHKDDKQSLTMQICTLKASLKFLREENNLLIQQITKSELSTTELKETLQSFRDQNDFLKEKNTGLKCKLNDYRSRYLKINALSMKLKTLGEMITL